VQLDIRHRRSSWRSQANDRRNLSSRPDCSDGLPGMADSETTEIGVVA